MIAAPDPATPASVVTSEDLVDPGGPLRGEVTRSFKQGARCDGSRHGQPFKHDTSPDRVIIISGGPETGRKGDFSASRSPFTHGQERNTILVAGRLCPDLSEGDTREEGD